MATYETMYIVHPEITPEKITALNDRLKGILEKNDASVINFEEWGKKKLAYRVKKQEKGHFHVINYDGPPKAINEFERIMKLSDDVIKFLSVQLSRDDVLRLEKRMAARAKAKAEAEAAAVEQETAEVEEPKEEQVVEEPAEELEQEAESAEESAEESVEESAGETSEEADEEEKEPDTES